MLQADCDDTIYEFLNIFQPSQVNARRILPGGCSVEPGTHDR